MTKSPREPSVADNPKIAFIDIETAPSLGYFYERFDLRISPDQIVHNGFILCYQAAWNRGQIFSSSLSGKKDLRPEDDKKLVVELVNLINRADIVVAHNAVRFDLARISARAAAHGMKPFRPPEVIDTLRACRAFFKFEGNSLDSVCQELGIGRKFHSGGYETTLKCLRDDAESWKKLIKYGEHDVKLLRDLYFRIRPFIRNHPNMNLYNGALEPLCRNCGSKKLSSDGHRYTAVGKRRRYVCDDCGSYSSERSSDIDKEKKEFILS